MISTQSQRRARAHGFVAMAAGAALALALANAQAATDVFGDNAASSYVYVNASAGGSGELTDTDSDVSTATLSFLLGSAWSQVDIPHGALRTFVQTSTSDVIESTGAMVTATAQLDDLFTVAGLPDIGMSHGIVGTLHVVGGLVTPANNGNTHYSGVVVDFAEGEWLQRELWSFPDGGEMNVDEAITHVFVVWPDQPFRVTALMQSYGQGFNHFDIMSNFSGTASLSFTLPPGASITSIGGFSQTAVPLPGSLALLAPTLLGFLPLARRYAAAAR